MKSMSKCLEFPQKSRSKQAEPFTTGEKRKLRIGRSPSYWRKTSRKISGDFTEQGSEAGSEFIVKKLLWFSVFRPGNWSRGLTKNARYYRVWFLGEQGQIARQQRNEPMKCANGIE